MPAQSTCSSPSPYARASCAAARREGRARWLLRVWPSLLAALLMSLAALPARADDLSEFESARARYERHEYTRAAEAFRALVGSEPPRVANALLVLESRKYYAASLLFVGNKAEARKQFRLLLEQEPEYTLDPLAFPKEVVTLFDDVKGSVREELAKRRESEAARELEEQRRARAAEELERTNLLRLTELAETQEQYERNSRWIASVPFGVGQFQNGDRGLGVALAMAEGLAVATSIVTYIGHEQISTAKPTQSELEETRNEERLWRLTNRVAFGTFAGLALIGLIDAHVRFVAGKVRARKRPLPEDLQNWVEQRNRQAWIPGFRF